MCPTLSHALEPHEPLAPSLLRHRYHQIHPSRYFILLFPTRTYALPKGRTITLMSVNPKTKVTYLMFSGCLPLPDFKKSPHYYHVQHGLSTLPTTLLALAAL